MDGESLCSAIEILYMMKLMCEDKATVEAPQFQYYLNSKGVVPLYTSVDNSNIYVIIEGVRSADDAYNREGS